MYRTGAAGVFSVMMAVSIIMGAYSMLSVPAVEGFDSAALVPPGDFTASPLPDPPAEISGDIFSRPEIAVLIFIPKIYVDYGGNIRLNITNNDSRSIFILELAFNWVGEQGLSTVTLNAELGSGETMQVKALAVSGPSFPGSHEYQLKMRVLQLRNGEWYRVMSSGDDWISFSSHTIDVEDLSETADNPIISNPRRYFTRVNDLVDFDSVDVAAASDEATEDFGAGFSIGKACAIFDYLDANIQYTTDPGDGDTWYSPDETLETMTGDCEDYAMLLAAMAEHEGGISRIYLTADHAFAAIYVGNTSSDMDRAAADVREYYGIAVRIHYFLDDNGYWLIADPLGSFHLGGLAVGQSPTEFEGSYWNATFTESETIYSIDVTGVNLSPPLWLEPNIWMGLILVFGFLTVGYAVAAQAEKSNSKKLCHICAGEIADDLYECPVCQTAYHRPCAFSRAYCMNCQSAIRFPPPPRNQNDGI